MSVGTSRLQLTPRVQPVGVTGGLPPPPSRIPSPDASQWLFTNLYTPQPLLGRPPTPPPMHCASVLPLADMLPVS